MHLKFEVRKILHRVGVGVGVSVGVSVRVSVGVSVRVSVGVSVGVSAHPKRPAFSCPHSPILSWHDRQAASCGCIDVSSTHQV